MPTSNQSEYIWSELNYTYKLAAPRKAFLCNPFVARILTPRSRKSGYGLLVGCRSALHRVFDKTTFFGDVRTKNWPETRKIFTGCSDTLSKSIGRGRISREGPLVVRESRKRRDKILAEKNILVRFF